MPPAVRPNPGDDSNPHSGEGGPRRTPASLAADPAFTGTYGRFPTVAHAAVQYVTPDGSDANNGLSWETAKATIPAAITALGSTGGRVFLAAGTHAVASTGRFDSCTFTSGSATVTDASVTNADVGSYVISPHVYDQAKITAVTPGVSFTMNFTAGASGTVNAIITKPAIVVPAGVELIGCGSSFNTNTQPQFGFGTQYSTTLIADSGTGVTIVPDKTATATNTGQNFSRIGLSKLTVQGNASNQFGFFGQNIWFGVAQDVTFQLHGLAGAVLAYNMNSTAFRDCRFIRNGTSTSTLVTAGALLSTPNQQTSSSVQFDNCFFTDNYGWGVAATNAARAITPWTGVTPIQAGTLINCQFNYTHASAATGSGVGAFISGENGQGALVGCWFESGDSTPLKITLHDGAVTAISCHFNGAGGSATPANLVDVSGGISGPRPGAFNAIGCYFRNASTTYVNLGSSASFNWMGCAIDQSNTTLPFVQQSGVTVATSTQAPGIGQVGKFGGVAYKSVAPLVFSGTATLAAGTVAVANTSITANSIVRLHRQAAGGTTGDLSVSLTAGTSFTINSSSGTETSTVYYEVVSY